MFLITAPIGAIYGYICDGRGEDASSCDLDGT
jgi:hypothetical protein